nr:hypothetical protein Q903MT_gene169 [Picea sitchensis]
MRIRTILALTKDTTYDITGGMKEGKVSDKDGGPATRTSPYISFIRSMPCWCGISC